MRKTLLRQIGQKSKGWGQIRRRLIGSGVANGIGGGNKELKLEKSECVCVCVREREERKLKNPMGFYGDL